MNYLILISVGIVGALLGYYLARDRKCSSLRRQNKNKKKRKKEILYFLMRNGKVRNNDVEKMLGVSDSTAEKYLNELEKEGKILQNGKTGRNVFYTLK